MNWKQRSILIAGGFFLLLMAFVEGAAKYDPDDWLILAEILAAISCFVISASSKRKPADG